MGAREGEAVKHANLRPANFASSETEPLNAASQEEACSQPSNAGINNGGIITPRAVNQMPARFHSVSARRFDKIQSVTTGEAVRDGLWLAP